MISRLIRALVTVAAIAISVIVIMQTDKIKTLLPEDLNILEELGIKIK